MYHIQQPMGTEHSVKVMVWLGDCWPLGRLTEERVPGRDVVRYTLLPEIQGGGEGGVDDVTNFWACPPSPAPPCAAIINPGPS